MKLFKTIALSVLAITIISCSTTTEVPKGEFATGVFIVNEGNFSESNGSVGHFNESEKTVTQDLYNEVNGVSPGGIIQSVYFYENLAFIIDNAGNRIEVVEAETFKAVSTIETGLSTPRYMIIENGKGYVSNWGEYDANFDTPNSYVAVINLSDFTVSKSINTDKGSEGLIAFGGSVYVANANSNTIEQIDPVSDTVSGSITTETGPVGFAEDKNGMVWVLSSSYFSGSALSKINLVSEEILTSFPISESAKSLNVNGAGDQLYYISGYGETTEVKMVSIDATEDSSSALITSPNLYGLGVDPTTSIIYLGNDNAFQGNGTIIRYEGNQLLDSYPAGIAPNGFVFRK